MSPQNSNEKAQKAIEEQKVSLSNIVKEKAITLWGDERGQQFASALVTASEKNPKIKSCTPESILSAMMACISINLVPETPAQFAYLIPYGNRIQFQIGYKGLIELAYRSGQIESINAELVFGEAYQKLDDGTELKIPADVFEHKLGTERGIVHQPNMNRDRTKFEEVTMVYATARLKNGTTVFEVMNISEIDKIRESAKAKSTDSPWNTWWDQMAKKTVIKRLCKYLPSSTEDNRLQEAIMYDNWAEAGKLKYENDRLIEGTPAVEERKNFETKSYMKAPEDTQTEPLSKDEIIASINSLFKRLDLDESEQMNTCNKYLNTPFLDKAKETDLAELLKYLSEQVKETE